MNIIVYPTSCDIIDKVLLLYSTDGTNFNLLPIKKQLMLNPEHNMVEYYIHYQNAEALPNSCNMYE